jgi:hypothetical protein
MITCPSRALRICALAMLGLIVAYPSAAATPPVQLNIVPSAPRVGEPVGVAFGCPNVGGLDRIDERRTRVRMVEGTIRMELYTKPDDSFGFCDEHVRLGWLPEGEYRLELWFDGVLSGQRMFSVLPPNPIPQGQRGPAHNYTGIYASPVRPGRNAVVIQSVTSSTLTVILTGYDLDRSTTNWLLICERWILPRQCVGTVYTSEGDPYTVTAGRTTATLTAIGTGGFGADGLENPRVGVSISIAGQQFVDVFEFLRY